MAEADLFGRRLAIVLGVQYPVEVQKKKIYHRRSNYGVLTFHPCVVRRKKYRLSMDPNFLEF